MATDKTFYEEIKNEKFKSIYPKDYADKLKKSFSIDKSLWYKRISPAAKADELYAYTNGDYSEIWHVHCERCFKSIDKNTKELCYISDDEITWLCEECYNSLF